MGGKFTRQPRSPEAQAAFLEEVKGEKRARGSLPSPVLVCVRCGWKVDAETARLRNITTCAQCGSRECKVHALDYNPAVPPPPPPTGAEIQIMARTPGWR